MADLGTLGGSTSWGYGVNAAGRLVGSSYLAGDTAFHAYVSDGGKMKDLGTLGGTNSIAFGINASGQISGDADTPAGPSTRSSATARR